LKKLPALIQAGVQRQDVGIKGDRMKGIRRSDREISIQEVIDILDNAEHGVLSTVSKDGQPYGVPLSYVYKNESIYFHCAVNGHKLENIEYNSRVSFCVVGKTKVLPDKFGTEYESAVVFGVASEVDGSERHDALLWLLEKYCSDFIEEGKQYIEQKDKITKVFRIEIDQISGKARR
jgi:nitroimidazol reductase NimA-like FMN-containing flavoprotein (pyridoxamine 5'-phosphate oxidase superfamily)